MTMGLAGPIEQLPVNRRTYAALLDSLRGIVWEADAATFQFRYVSSHAESLLGFPRSEWLSDPEFWRNHTHPDDLARAASFCRECIAQGRDHDFEYRMIARDGRVVWLRDIVTVDRSATGEVRLTGIMIDITGHRAMEDALRASQEWLAHAQKAGRVGTFDWDLVTDVARWTPELTALYGEPTLPTHKETWFTRVHPDDLMTATDAVQEAMDTGMLDIEYRVRWPDGTIRWLQARGRASRGADGRPARMLGAVVDVTDRKLLEQELHHAQKMDALGRLAGGIAHDFNNLLTVIASRSELLADASPLSEEGEEDVREIRHAAERGAQLIRQLLAFSRKDVVQPRPVELDAEVADVLTMLGRVLGSHVRLVLDLQCETRRILIAPGHIQQIVMNLAVNARDAMPGGGTLSIRTRPVDAGLSLTVEDTGEGMTDVVKARIFEPFFTTKEPGKGTGLGLSTVFGIVKQANATIDVRSQQSGGTAIEVCFPPVG